MTGSGQFSKELYEINTGDDTSGSLDPTLQDTTGKHKGRMPSWCPTPWRPEDQTSRPPIEMRSAGKEVAIDVAPVCDIDHKDRLGSSEAGSGSPGDYSLSSPERRWFSSVYDAACFQAGHAHFKRLKTWVLQEKDYIPDPLGRTLHIRPATVHSYLERRSQKPYIGNHITSSRYTIYNFLPRQLAFQFSKVANIYFLSVSILQMIPGLSTTGTYTTIVPLSIFLAIAIAREGYDDLRRHKMDTIENKTPVTKLCVADTDASTIAVQTVWHNLKVGDILRLSQDEWIPADIVLLKSDHADETAYVETAALDGETNLKTKRAVRLLSQECSEARLAALDITIESEAPNKDLYNYQGNVCCDGVRRPLTSENVIYRGSILRNTPEILAVVIFTGEECKIRLNASARVRTKRPSMQKLVNRVVMAVAAFVIGLSVFCTCGYYIWHSRTESRLWYLDAATSISFFPIFVSFLILYNTMVPLSLYVSMEIVKLIQQLLLQQDIDLFHAETNTPAEARTATINEELGQVTHVFTDKTGTLTENEMIFRRISVAGHAWSHTPNHELEQSEAQPFLRQKARKERFSFHRRSTTALHNVSRKNSSDQLRKFSLGHILPHRTSLQNPLRLSTTSPKVQSIQQDDDTVPLRSTVELLSYMQDHPHTVFARKARTFLLSVALCHTVMLSNEANSEDRSFSAASPDELALVKAATELGYVMINRDTQSVMLKSPSVESKHSFIEETYQIHEVLEFSSMRKRMSIIFSFPDGRICIMCKGADSVLTERLRHHDLVRKKRQSVSETINLRRSLEAGQALARRSLARPSISRPSMSGNSRIESMRELDRFFDSKRTETQEELLTKFREHSTRHSIAFGEASIPLQKSRNNLVDEGISNNEATILQRTFQHLDSFASEGLRVLMYGHRFLSIEEHRTWKASFQQASVSLIDRQEKIDHLAELIERNFELTGATAIEDKLQEGVPASIEKLHRAGIKMWMLTGDKRETAINIGHSTGLIKDYSTIIILDHVNSDMRRTLADRIDDVYQGRLAHSVMVVDGQTLSAIDLDAELTTLFVQLSVAVDTTVCCRASPSQKAALVRQVRKGIKSAITLAIGDGANDIAMIKEAHIGIGITGKEGLQAARSSDYSIAQFRFLVKLLLVHGRWNYMRVCKYVLGTFYKEILLFLTQAIFQQYAGYTGTSLHESWSLSLFNTLFSSLAVICLGAFEKDLSASTLLAVPELYETGRLGRAFSIKIFLGWMLLAASQSVLCFYLAYFALAWPNDYLDLFPLGDLIFTTIVIVINVKLIFVEMHTWSILNYSFFAISFIGWWIWQVLQAVLYNHTVIYYVKEAFLTQFGKSLVWWASITLVIITILLMDIILQVTRSTFMPTEEDKFRELQSDKVLKARLEEEAAQELQAGWIEDLLARRGLDSQIVP